jgi:glycosyltransferase involved in cell wall biosynthesis
MPKVVLLSAFLSPQRSGAEAMVEEVAVRLPNSFDVTIVTGRYSWSNKKHDTLGGKVAVRRVGLGLSIDKYLFPFLAPFVAATYRPSIIHAVLESYAGLALVFCTYIVPRAKRVLTLQSTNTTFMLRAMHKSAHIITAISTVLVERAKNFGRNDVVLIANGIDLSGIEEAKNYHAKDSGRVLFVGRLEQMKGVDTLLKAFAIAIRGLNPSVHLRIVGEGSQASSLKKLATELEIDHRVTFVGHVSPKAVLDEYAQAEIFCGLSRSEALGNVFIEAQAAGCAILATNTGGIPDIVKDGESGLLVKPDDVEETARALRELLNDVSLRARLSVAGQKNAARYGWEGVAKRYAEVLQKL